MKYYLAVFVTIFSSLSYADLVSDKGVMGVSLGMPVDKAMSILKGYVSSEKEYDEGWGCYELLNIKNRNLPWFYIGKGSVSSIKFSGIEQKTEKGIGVGSTKKEIYKVYNVVKAIPHHYFDVGEYLVVNLLNGNGFHFETKNDVVTRFHLTRTPENISVEGCF